MGKYGPQNTYGAFSFHMLVAIQNYLRTYAKRAAADLEKCMH